MVLSLVWQFDAIPLPGTGGWLALSGRSKGTGRTTRLLCYRSAQCAGEGAPSSAADANLVSSA